MQGLGYERMFRAALRFRDAQRAFQQVPLFFRVAQLAVRKGQIRQSLSDLKNLKMGERTNFLRLFLRTKKANE